MQEKEPTNFGQFNPEQRSVLRNPTMQIEVYISGEDLSESGVRSLIAAFTLWKKSQVVGKILNLQNKDYEPETDIDTNPLVEATRRAVASLLEDEEADTLSEPAQQRTEKLTSLLVEVSSPGTGCVDANKLIEGFFTPQQPE